MNIDEIIATLKERGLLFEQEKLEEYLSPAIKQFATDFQEYLDSGLDGLKKELASPQPSPKDDKGGQEDPLGARLKQLEADLAAQKAAFEAKEKEANQLAFNQSLTEAITATGTQFPNEATKFLSGLFEGAVKYPSGNWVAKDGKTISEHTKTFFESPFGKHLLPADTASGSGSKPTKPVTGQTDVSTGEALMEAFMG